MSKAELLSMLTARGVTPSNTPGGGVPTFTQMDAAAMMAKLTDNEFRFLSAKYRLDGVDFKHTYIAWLKVIKEQGFTSTRIGIEEALASATLQENMDGLVCRSCGGNGGVTVGLKVITCDRCGGAGRCHWSNRQMARALHLKSNELKEPWRTRVDWCRRYLRIWEGVALQKIRY